MKRLVIILLVFVLLTAGSIMGSRHFALQERTVTFSGETEYGDSAEAEGLSVSVQEYLWADGMDGIFTLKGQPNRWDSTVVYANGGMRTENGFRKDWEEYSQFRAQKEREEIDANLFRMSLRRNEELKKVLGGIGKILYTACGDSVLFTFDPHTADGTTVDLSKVAGGYGIYAVPNSKFRGQHNYPSDVIAVFAELEPEIHVKNLQTSPDGSRVFLLYQKDRRLYIRVLNRLGATEEEEILLMDEEQSDNSVIGMLFDNDVFTVSVQNGVGGLDCHVFARDEAGRWKKETVIRNIPEEPAAEKEETVRLAYDKGRLAKVVYDGKLHVSVYKENGIVFRGIVESSLKRLEESGKGEFSIRLSNLECSWCR